MEYILHKYKYLFEETLPEFFAKLNKQCLRGRTIGMEIGKLRERNIVALLQVISEMETKQKFFINYDLDDKLAEIDCYFNYTGISIKTYTGKSIHGIKIVWTVDKKSCKDFVKNYEPCVDLLIVNIPNAKDNKINDTGYIYYIPQKVQDFVFDNLNSKYFKMPMNGRNSRGIELSRTAFDMLIDNKNTTTISFNWNCDKINHLYDPTERMRNDIRNFINNKKYKQNSRKRSYNSISDDDEFNSKRRRIY